MQRSGGEVQGAGKERGKLGEEAEENQIETDFWKLECEKLTDSSNNSSTDDLSDQEEQAANSQQGGSTVKTSEEEGKKEKKK